jgi:uncharacterized NAD-dependent epimerase/dehydratase family protein
MEIKQPYLLYLGNAADDLAAKTAFGVFDWRPHACVGQVRLPGCVPRLELPEMSIEEGADRGARTLMIGAANRGGIIPPEWEQNMVDALNLGMDIANGLHMRVSDFARVKQAAEVNGRALHEVRHPQGPFIIGTGARRRGKRLLTVGTDCSVGKMYTSLAIADDLVKRGVKVDFRATGQTGIMIDGRGVCIDGVVSDYLAGAVEQLCPDNDEDHWDIIEGQGSLFHPSFSGVTLGLIHGSQPDVIVLCHEPTRAHMRGLPGRAPPEIGRCIEANLEAARLVSENVYCAGIAVNTTHLENDEALSYLEELELRHGLDCVDPVRTGVGHIVERVLST